MWISRLSVVLALAVPAAAFESPLPELKIEAVSGGSVLVVKNLADQPLTAYLIELVDYPGSSYARFQDDGSTIEPGSAKRISVTNMTIGAVPDYVKVQAAIYQDGSSGGVPAKISELLERRRFTLETVRELFHRMEKQQSKEDLIVDLQQWAMSMPVTKANQGTQQGINRTAGRAVLAATIESLKVEPLEQVVASVRGNEREIARRKPELPSR